jgi:oligopeptide transport system ATP-binding protein
MAAALELQNLCVRFETPDGDVAAVSDLTLSVRAGECLGVVGESGAGKSQAFLAALGLLPPNGSATGSARLLGQELVGLSPSALNEIRGVKLAMIFQDPMTSLAPHIRIGDQIAESIVVHRGTSWHTARAAALRLLEQAQVTDAARRLVQYPHELSGGLRQRVMIAIALACDPVVLIADEPTTALDVAVQAQILALLRDLMQQRQMGLIVITHDFGIVAGLADQVAVLYAGRLVEHGAVTQVLQYARHPYTSALLRSMPRIDDSLEVPLAAIRGQPPNPRTVFRGCAFAERCDFASMICVETRPLLAPEFGHRAACRRCMSRC